MSESLAGFPSFIAGAWGIDGAMGQEIEPETGRLGSGSLLPDEGGKATIEAGIGGKLEVGKSLLMDAGGTSLAGNCAAGELDSGVTELAEDGSSAGVSLGSSIDVGVTEPDEVGVENSFATFACEGSTNSTASPIKSKKPITPTVTQVNTRRKS